MTHPNSAFLAPLLALTLAAASTLSLPAMAVTPGTALQAIAQFEKLHRPDRTAPAFEHWAYNTTLNTVMHCALAAKIDQSAPFFNAKWTAAGAFALPDEATTERLCTSLAVKGVSPMCTHAVLWVEGVSRVPGLPGDYLQVSSKVSKLDVRGSLYCHLNTDQILAQSFSEPLAATWFMPPHPQSINVPGGPRMLNTGNVMVTASSAKGMNGLPYSEPRLAVVID